MLTNCTFPPISVKNIRSFSRFRNVPRPLELPPNFRSRETDNPSPDTAIFPNLVGAPSATCLIWEYTESIPGTPCPNPPGNLVPEYHAGCSQRSGKGSLPEFRPPYSTLYKQETDLRHRRTPPFPPIALAWLWRPVAPTASPTQHYAASFWAIS